MLFARLKFTSVFGTPAPAAFVTVARAYTGVNGCIGLPTCPAAVHAAPIVFEHTSTSTVGVASAGALPKLANARLALIGELPFGFALAVTTPAPAIAPAPS